MSKIDIDAWLEKQDQWVAAGHRAGIYGPTATAAAARYRALRAAYHARAWR